MPRHLPLADYDVAMILNYYPPYISGLTMTAQTIAEALACRGHKVAVVTCCHDPSLPAAEIINGVSVLRTRVLGKVSRGPVSPSFVSAAVRIARSAAVVNFHIPMLEAGLISRLIGKVPLVTTYHADIPTDGGMVNALAAHAVTASARSTLRRSARVVVNSKAAAHQSRLRTEFESCNISAISAPCHDRRGGTPRYRLTSGLHVGFAGRIHAEKGVDHLIEAFRMIPDPGARLLIAGDYLKVAGGSSIDRVREMAAGDSRIHFLGLLTGVPAVTTDSPGGRVPVMATGFGQLVPPRDPAAIARAIRELSSLSNAEREAGAQRARRQYGISATVDAYEKLFVSLRADSASSGGRVS
jgi:glycosyltransferase involved in cell wall biosynthesis